MPLSDVIPVIDDRRYDQLVAEIRTRIARYTPEWTPIWSDVNDSDPGITLAQLFGWMTELLTYRLGLVPELNYIKFLQLLGIELTPAQPATTQLTFPVTAAFTEPYVIVPLRTQVSADSPTGSGPPVIFETDKALVAVAATLSAVLAYDGYSATDVSSVNTSAALGFAPFGNFAAEGSALMLGFSAGGGLPQGELDLAVWVSPGATRPPAAQCGLAASYSVEGRNPRLYRHWPRRCQNTGARRDRRGDNAPSHSEALLAARVLAAKPICPGSCLADRADQHRLRHPG
jgi:predicted phage baseplate assembly protein